MPHRISNKKMNEITLLVLVVAGLSNSQGATGAHGAYAPSFTPPDTAGSRHQRHARNDLMMKRIEKAELETPILLFAQTRRFKRSNHDDDDKIARGEGKGKGDDGVGNDDGVGDGEDEVEVDEDVDDENENNGGVDSGKVDDEDKFDADEAGKQAKNESKWTLPGNGK